MNKKRVHITLDGDLIECAKTKLGMPLSTFLNIALAEELNASNEIEEVKKEIQETESHLTFLQSRLCRLEKDKAIEIDKNKSIELAFETLTRIHNAHGKVGENQIRNIAGNYKDKVTFADLKNKCIESDFNVVKAFEPDKIGVGGKNGSGFPLK